VDNTFPGQTVKARIAKKRKKFAECKLLEVVERSPQEVEVPYQPISGAPYITLPIELQHKYKQSSTIDIYRKLGSFYNSEELFEEFIPSPNIFDYRNKMEYSFSTIRKELSTGEELDDQLL
jgi:tRNA/tmRNA/rRNA uracil-C5-methylase (TrmA/RlmC/RlmD family)